MCPRCNGQHIVDPMFLEETKKACADLMVELVIFAKKHKLDHNNMPVLTEVARVIRELQSL